MNNFDEVSESLKNASEILSDMREDNARMLESGRIVEDRLRAEIEKLRKQREAIDNALNG